MMFDNFKTRSGYHQLLITMPHHVEDKIQNIRSRIYREGGGSLFRFFVPFLFAGWIPEENKLPSGMWIQPFTLLRTVKDQDNLIFLSTDLTVFEPEKNNSDIEWFVPQGFFMGRTDSILPVFEIPAESIMKAKVHKADLRFDCNDNPCLKIFQTKNLCGAKSAE